MISVRVNRNSQSVRDEILTEPAMPEAKSGSSLQSPPLPGGAAVMRGGTAATVVATVGPKGGESGDTAPLTPPDVALHPLHSGDTQVSHKPVSFVFYSMGDYISPLPTTATYALGCPDYSERLSENHYSIAT